MKRLALLAALVAGMAPGTAFAAKDIGCIAARLSPDMLARIGAREVASLDSDSKTDWLAEDREAVIAARNACRQANGWSNDATDLAMNYFEAATSLATVEPLLAAQGLDAAAMRAAYAALPEPDRRSIVMSDKLSPGAEALLRQAAGKRDDPKFARRLSLVVAFIGGLAAIEFYPAQFAAL